ncbi:putative membrane protein [Campylobacter vicugnae]|uniref:Membrane protein n=1 Tax=Campylobacter vicugnae TaxID=1660076 RepID=A0A1X9T2P3_9BACT|nr:hypothetical protein [Campylobacter sp. RM8964]ARR02669.1 putative membrane protein [Campylobacter sp. RM8964]
MFRFVTIDLHHTASEIITMSWINTAYFFIFLLVYFLVSLWISFSLSQGSNVLKRNTYLAISLGTTPLGAILFFILIKFFYFLKQYLRKELVLFKKFKEENSSKTLNSRIYLKEFYLSFIFQISKLSKGFKLLNNKIVIALFYVSFISQIVYILNDIWYVFYMLLWWGILF